MTDATTALRDILSAAGRPLGPSDKYEITGKDPVLPTHFLLGTAASAALAAVGLAAADLWELRTGSRQRVGVDTRIASIALRSERYLQVDGKTAHDLWRKISGVYQTKDGRWIQLHCNFPHHAAGTLEVLGCEEDRDAVTKAVAGWNAAELEYTLAEAGMCARMLRSPEEWAAHDQAKALAELPLIEIVKIADSAPEPLPKAAKPLSGIRGLDLTRVLAGPVSGKLLAGFGADIMRIAGPHLPFSQPLVIDTGFGKLSAHIDLRDKAGRDKLLALAREADVFTQAYRPGTIAARGFTPEALAEARPGIVCVSLCAYSHAGPWRGLRGFDSLVQTASGISYEGGEGKGPGPLPAQALDHISGYLAAFGTMIALGRRAREGGSWLVRLSLAQTGRWIDGLGRLGTIADARKLHDPKLDDVRDLTMETDSPFGRLMHLKPPIGLSETPMGWSRPPVPLGTHQPAWPA
ncbi:MAG: CoA transferase [Alphaproteobacteria bacterium]|nr:CoA transferase [Alphaproteobacteria bacterium]